MGLAGYAGRCARQRVYRCQNRGHGRGARYLPSRPQRRRNRAGLSGFPARTDPHSAGKRLVGAARSPQPRHRRNPKRAARQPLPVKNHLSDQPAIGLHGRALCRDDRRQRHAPYWQYVAVNDSRTRESHRKLHGRVYAADDPVWDTLYPPLDYRCRCRVRPLSRAQGEDKVLPSPQLETITVDIGANKSSSVMHSARASACRTVLSPPPMQASMPTKAKHSCSVPPAPPSKKPNPCRPNWPKPPCAK